MNALSGIYLLKNNVNGKIYIGKANNISRRISRHRSTEFSKNQRNTKICKAIRKYGWENFTVEILESFESIDNETLLRKESEWIKKLKAIENGYNILAYHTDWTGNEHTEETKQKMSLNHADYSGKNHPRFGMKHSEESKRKMSKTRMGMYKKESNPFWGKTHSKEVKQKISQFSKSRDWSWKNKSVKQINITSGEVIRIWPSIKSTGVSNVACVCRGRQKTAGGFKWEYV
jgi:group I intron endonuclease